MLSKQYVDELLSEYGSAHSLVCSFLLGLQKVRQQIEGKDMMGKYKLVSQDMWFKEKKWGEEKVA